MYLCLLCGVLNKVIISQTGIIQMDICLDTDTIALDCTGQQHKE